MGLSSPDGGGAPGSPDIGSILKMIGGGNSAPWANGSGGGTFGDAAPGRATAPPPGQDLASLLQGGGRGGPPPGTMPPTGGPMPPMPMMGGPGATQNGVAPMIAALMGNGGGA